MAKLNITIRQGETFRLGFNWYNPLLDANGDPILDDDGNVQPDETSPVDLTGWTARMQVRPTARSATVLLDLSTTDGEITIDGAAGRVDVEATPEQTSAITRSGRYDLELTSAGGEVHRLLEGRARLSHEVTRA